MKTPKKIHFNMINRKLVVFLMQILKHKVNINHNLFFNKIILLFYKINQF